MSGACCQGGYCLQASYAGDRDGSGLRSKERRRSHGSRVGTPVCPFQMAFKSVLLDRAEEKLLGSSCKDKLREDILACDGKVRSTSSVLCHDTHYCYVWRIIIVSILISLPETILYSSH